MSDWKKHEANRMARYEREIAARVLIFEPLDTETLRAKLKGATPWQRTAIRRVLKARGVEV